MPSNCRPSTWYGTFFSTIVLSFFRRPADTSQKTAATPPDIAVASHALELRHRIREARQWAPLPHAVRRRPLPPRQGASIRRPPPAPAGGGRGQSGCDGRDAVELQPAEIAELLHALALDLGAVDVALAVDADEVE